METKKQTVEQMYNDELQEIENQLDLFKKGEIYDFQLLNKIKNLAIRTYYDGISKGINDTRQIYRNNQ